MRRRKKYYLLKYLASLARLAGFLLPGWGAADRIATRLAYVRSVYGPYLLNTPGDRTFELCVEGYGRFVSDAVRNQDGPFVFLDIGANLGLFSLIADANPFCERAIAIEPLPGIFSNLEANIARNGARKVEPVLGAVATTCNRVVGLSFDARHSGLSRTAAGTCGPASAPVVSAGKLDGLFARLPDRIVAKIDVEGSEIDVLSTLRASRIYGAIEEIVIEVSEANLGLAGRQQLLDMLAQDGFEELARGGSPRHYDARFRRNGAPRATVWPP